jgi:uncharacterized protein (DUF362 family)
MSLVSFVKAERSNVKNAIENSLNLIDYQFEKNIQEIVIKPNMCYYWDYSTGQTTDPKFVAATIEILREKISPDVNISIIESDASAMKCKYVFKFLGYEKIANQYNVKLVNLSKAETERVKVKVGNQNFNLMIPKIIKNADLRINISKIKYLELTKISCALKNVFGCNPYPKKFKYHTRLDATIVALNKIMKFDLCIVDGIIISGVQPRKLGLVMASLDPVALDAAASKIAGINPKAVRHIMLAASEGVGSPYFIPKGMSPHYFERRYPRKRVANKLMTLGYQLIQLLGLENRLE